jgi:hypothetical protein
MDCLKDDTKAANVIVELQIEPYSLVEAERDYLSVCKRYSKLYVVPEFSKLVACWMGKEAGVSLNSFIRSVLRNIFLISQII